MKYFLITLGILCLVLNSNAQIVRVENAKYFDNKHELYNGLYTEYYDNGNKKLEMYLVNGEQDSTTFLYNDSGRIYETRSYKHGLMHGKWETFNNNGKKIAEAWYRNDQKDGVWRIWDENGILRFEMPYSNGQRISVWKKFNENGDLESEHSYGF